VERAELVNGQSILDLGCGWGSCSLFFAKKFPGSKVTGLSNSWTQKQYIDAKAKELGIGNLTIITANVAEHEFKPASFDRVVSIEMFEHIKNYEDLMAKVARWLSLDGKLFVHIFAHSEFPYEYGNEGWMAQHFFNNGNMLSADLLLHFQQDLKISKQWYVSGYHYARTCEVRLFRYLSAKGAFCG
jgi:cyclopropane fatty-acyl-phospholipid synthase-like methyltransferase